MSDELDLARGALIFVAAAGGGVLNAVVGGGSFLSFPALIAIGVPAVPANATSTLALWPGGISSAYGYRKHLRGARRLILGFGGASVLGGLLGSLLLLKTENDAFRRLVPWLLLAATSLFSLGPLVLKRLARPAPASPAPAPAAASPAAASPTTPGAAPADAERSQDLRWFAPALLVQFLVAIYGGYFGGGMGILLLATLSLVGLEDLHFMNGVKNLLSTIVNGVALVAFVRAGAIVWAPGLVMVVGATLGGYAGARLATRAKPGHVRAFVTAVAWGLTAWFFVHDFVLARGA